MFFHSDLKVSPEFIATPRKKSIFKSRQSKNKKKKNIKKLCKKMINGLFQNFRYYSNCYSIFVLWALTWVIESIEECDSANSAIMTDLNVHWDIVFDCFEMCLMIGE